MKNLCNIPARLEEVRRQARHDYWLGLVFIIVMVVIAYIPVGLFVLAAMGWFR